MKSDIEDMIQTILALVLLGFIIEFSGTDFFGVDLFPFILIIVVAAMILKGLQSDKTTLKWVQNKLKRMFG